jgi:transposase InsO family protein
MIHSGDLVRWKSRCGAARTAVAMAAARRVARALTALIGRRGRPGMIVSDNWTEFASNALLSFASDSKFEWRYIAPGKPI